jgi:hypothetical protein
LGTFLAIREHRIIGAALPVGFVLAASFQHVRSRFETPRSQWSRVAPAVAVDSAMLTAYFAGRLAGLTALRRRPDPALSQERGRRVSRLGPRWPKACSSRCHPLHGEAKVGVSSYLQRRYYSVGHSIPVVLGQPELVMV